MHRLTYVSTAHKAVSSIDLQDILEAAIRNNERDGVTGMLLYNGANFMQVLEGPEEAINTVYNRICSDKRHGHVVTVLRESGTRRSFDDNPMTLKTVESHYGKLPNGMVKSESLDDFLPAGVPDFLRSMLLNFNTMKG